MLNRVVSIGSLFVVAASVFFFVVAALELMQGKMEGFDGIFALTGWLLAGIVFAWRSTDPAWLDPVSIVK